MKANPTQFWSYALPWVLVLLLAGGISYMKPRELALLEDLSPGQYVLETKQDGESDLLNGPVYFTYSRQKGGLGNQIVFKLHFTTSGAEDGPGIGFLVPLGNSGEEMPQGTYRVDAGRQGLITGYETVFGYADFPEEAGAILFTESGSLLILESQRQEVSGQLDVVLSDGQGRSIALAGSFRALPLPANIKL